MQRVAEYVRVQRAAPRPLDQRRVRQLLSAGDPLGSFTFTDRANHTLRQRSRCHNSKVRRRSDRRNGSGWMTSDVVTSAAVRAFAAVRNLPYATDSVHDSAGLRLTGRGDCVAKSGLLIKELARLGLTCSSGALAVSVAGGADRGTSTSLEVRRALGGWSVSVDDFARVIGCRRFRRGRSVAGGRRVS